MSTRPGAKRNARSHWIRNPRACAGSSSSCPRDEGAARCYTDVVPWQQRIMSDEGFHEIQLNGKQLVFLFMAATVVSVVIFLCGVLVGRGVRSQLSVTDTTAPSTVAETTPTQPAMPAQAPAAGSDPTAAAAPPATDELSYFKRLEKQNPPAEQLKPAPDRSASSERTVTPPAASPTPAPAP